MITCLDSILEPSGSSKTRLVVFDSKEQTEKLQQSLTNLLASDSMEDASHLTRQMAIRCLMHLKYRADIYNMNNLERFLMVYAGGFQVDKVLTSDLTSNKLELK